MGKNAGMGKVMGSIQAVVVCIALCLGAPGCVSRSQARSEMDSAAASLRNELTELTAASRSSLEQARADNDASLLLVDNLRKDLVDLERALGELKKALADLKRHIDTSVADYEERLTDVVQKGDQQVYGTVTKEHNASIAAMRKEMQRVQEAGARAEELARTLKKVLAAYQTAGEGPK